ncbi:uncharacterized protein [Physcomitrium patens]|uniref:Uncharacterized protein n=1 Tax=Physcomitrium patens TaxID=3218 RepID=A0A2K1JTH3_PHYPA|nr:uncharacterized protein LOC112288310 [Physcomitrium patens]PNR44843.1 hypothetical protein PHYPA_014613 [Physcomitrium patens]|eukprot:XP_024388164.1 uncharacterized protein LOC112288310 [Physcomitrella patens]
MKRNQHEEDNCGHWEYVIPCEFVSADAVLNYGVVPSYFGTTIRRLRFTLAMSQECVEDMSALEDSAYPEGDYHRRTHRTRGDVDVDRLSEMIASRRAQFTGNRFDERSNDLHEHDASVSGAGYGLLNDSEVPVFEVYEDNDPAESEDTFQRVVRKSSNSIFPIDLRRIGTGVGSDKVVESKFEDDADKENQDPIVEGVVTYTRSPLPEWYPRRPLQDITNVLVSDPDDKLPPPKKKRNKNMIDGTGSSLLTLVETPPRKQCLGVSRPTVLSGVASRQVFNLRKGFR